MEIKFKIQFTSAPGMLPVIRFTEHSGEKQMEVPMVYADEHHWQGTLNSDEHPFSRKFVYSIIIKNNELPGSEYELLNGKINLGKYKSDTVYIVHSGKSDGQTDLSKSDIFKILIKKNKKARYRKQAKAPTHIFRIPFQHLQKDLVLCITGSAKKMNEWDLQKPLLFGRKGIALNLSKENFPVEYKLAVYDTEKKAIVQYEEGPNRILEDTMQEHELTVLNLPMAFEKFYWKGAGINIPVSALRRADGWGTGDFTDLLCLIDWADDAGFKMLQLLPVTDTTATHTDRDSYPYSPITTVALHPQFLNVAKLAKCLSHHISDEQQEEAERLNNLSFIDQPAVMRLKIQVLLEIFENEKAYFKDDMDWFTFFDLNREWLVPYAVFCYLRDKTGSTDSKDWGAFSKYSEEDVQDLASHESEAYDEIAFWYFVQYHLHLQLQDATDYAHKKRIILKADLPIGVDRNSVDTWMNPAFFDMGMQAGAPPDFFTPKGQNWSFPTYNWDEMEFDDYSWFRKRLQLPEKYFDALRIDHVLGLFRIWSIQVNQTDGVLGRFIPSIPLSDHAFRNAGIDFNEERLCNPFITHEFLLQKFGADADAVKEIFFENGKLKSDFDDQQKITTYFKEHREHKDWLQGLFDVISNVILMKDLSQENAYVFRIDMQHTHSFAHLAQQEKQVLDRLYHEYFFKNQHELWRAAGTKKLQMMKESTKMLLCAEDLGVVPDFMPEVLQSLHILSLEVQQMGKLDNTKFSAVEDARYESVVMPGTHDMATTREWWETDRSRAQNFYNAVLKEEGEAPYFCEPWISRKIINMHLRSSAMWSVFLMQDLLAMNGAIRRANPFEERINDPADDKHVWKYRMHLNIEDLSEEKAFRKDIKKMIRENGR